MFQVWSPRVYTVHIMSHITFIFLPIIPLFYFPFFLFSFFSPYCLFYPSLEKFPRWSWNHPLPPGGNGTLYTPTFLFCFFISFLLTTYHDSLGEAEVEDVDDVLERDAALRNVGGQDHLPLVRTVVLEDFPRNISLLLYLLKAKKQLKKLNAPVHVCTYRQKSSNYVQNYNTTFI